MADNDKKYPPGMNERDQAAQDFLLAAHKLAKLSQTYEQFLYVVANFTMAAWAARGVSGDVLARVSDVSHQEARATKAAHDAIQAAKRKTGLDS